MVLDPTDLDWFYQLLAKESKELEAQVFRKRVNAFRKMDDYCIHYEENHIKGETLE